MRSVRCTAIVLAAGQGKRMNSSTPKQFLVIDERPILYYCLNTFQNSKFIDEIILVVSEEVQEYCKREFVEKYAMNKISNIVLGGKERYLSVWNGLASVKEGYVFIHDGARPFVDDGMIERAYRGVREYSACVVGMPVKDTIKIVDENGFARETPPRNELWMIQTPQVFEADLVKEAYSQFIMQGHHHATDDAMIVEEMMKHPVKLIKGSYENIKITTPEDLKVANSFAQSTISL